MNLPVKSNGARMKIMFKNLFLATGVGIVLLGIGTFTTQWEFSGVKPKSQKEKLPFPSDIENIFSRACLDCHTPYTKIPFYGYIFPVTLYLQDHVKEGLEELNLVDWEKLSPKQKYKKAEEIIEDLEEGEMPPKSYLILHPEAKITQEELIVFKEWFQKIDSEYE
jgi:hypothetical protein